MPLTKVAVVAGLCVAFLLPLDAQESLDAQVNRLLKQNAEKDAKIAQLEQKLAQKPVSLDEQRARQYRMYADTFKRGREVAEAACKNEAGGKRLSVAVDSQNVVTIRCEW